VEKYWDQLKYSPSIKDGRGCGRVPRVGWWDEYSSGVCARACETTVYAMRDGFGVSYS